MKILKGSALKESFFAYKDSGEIPAINGILKDVRRNGDSAIKRHTLKFDGVRLLKIRVTAAEIKSAYKKVNPKIITALKQAAANIRKFSREQLSQFKDFDMEISPGVFTGQKVIPIERVGVYVPGGKFPLASTLLMCAIPAGVAGVSGIFVCSPPSYKGSIHPVILVAADIVGISEVYKVGGVQAIAAMAYGTQTIKKADKIVGPGNKYVALAKKEVFGQVGIDCIAGPSEIIIIADETANSDYLAADLLAQAEHDADALPILITTSFRLAERVNKAVELQLGKLKTKDTAKISISRNGLIIIAGNMEEAINIANKKAPEHLELQVKNPRRYI
ncbi:MAG: histidinol dehydrogenase, partial [Planctomycetota bacterium]